MKPIIRFSQVFLLLSFFIAFQAAHAQDKVDWLEDYTAEMQVGNDTYRYKFTNIDGNDCKIRIEELLTDKKGDTESQYWEFYLSDIDPAAISFDSKGKSIAISMETRQSQEFISYYEEGEFEEYTEEIELTMNEVSLGRSFIEAFRENIDECKQTQATWSDREEAFGWLKENIGNATDDDIKWNQEFKESYRPYLVEISSTSTDEDGEQESFQYFFDLNDINPLGINLEVSGKSLSVLVPVRAGENFIEMETPEETEYTDEVVIYADDIEMARQIVNALSYLVTNTMPDRPEWNSYTEAMKFVQENLGEVKVGDDTYYNAVLFDEDPAGIVEFTVRETDEDGESEEEIHFFYLTDIVDKLNLDVSKSEIIVEMETKNGKDYIRETEEGSVSGYESDLDFHMGNIDLARDVINAFEYAIRNSVEEIEEFSSVADVNSWMEDNFPVLSREGETYEQKMRVNVDQANQIIFDMKLTEDDNEVTETQYIIYPEDIGLEEMEIDVSSGRLTVAIETPKEDFIKNYENGMLEDFTDEAEVYFFDPLTAKNFIAAIKYLKENTPGTAALEMDKAEAIAFLNENIPNIKLEEEEYEQSLSVEEEAGCKMSFKRVVTEDDGEVNEYIYEFIASDLHRGNSELSVSGELIEINLVTAGEDDLIKPIENGEVEDFESEFMVYADDVALAKRILEAFAALSEACK